MNHLILTNPSKLLSYTMVYFAVYMLIVYLLRVPYYISNSESLANEYYVTNFLTNIPLDYVLVLIYLEIALFVSRQLGLRQYFTKTLMVVVLTTALLTGSFLLYFTQSRQTQSFFSRWFHTVTWRSVVYDMIILGSVYYGYEFMCKATRS